MTLHQERAAAVQRLVDETRAIEKAGVTRANLEKIGGLLAVLAGRAELFPQEEFPLGADGGIYRLAEDPDNRFALYASAGLEGKLVQPHNHTTWAVIAGVHGQEHNVRYDRVETEGANDPNHIELAKGSDLLVEKGNSIQFLPDDFHTIQVPVGGAPALHLHLYGLSLEHLPRRGTCLPHRLIELPHAARTVGVLVPVFRIALSLDYPNACPIGLELVGKDHGQSGADTGAHFRAMCDNRHEPRLVDADIDIGLEARRRRRLGEREIA